METWMIGYFMVWLFAIVLGAFGIWQKRKLDRYEREQKRRASDQQ